MNFTVSDFTEGERELVAELLQQRYNKPVSVDLAHTPDDDEYHAVADMTLAA